MKYEDKEYESFLISDLFHLELDRSGKILIEENLEY